jgi:hypothetical protein
MRKIYSYETIQKFIEKTKWKFIGMNYKKSFELDEYEKCI